MENGMEKPKRTANVRQWIEYAEHLELANEQMSKQIVDQEDCILIKGISESKGFRLEISDDNLQFSFKGMFTKGFKYPTIIQLPIE